MTAWSLVSYRTPMGTERAGAAHGGRILDLPIQAEGVLAIVEAWDELEPLLREFDPTAAPQVVDAVITLPLRHPRKLICAGANYRRHVEEMGFNPHVKAQPYFFFKPPTTALVGPGEPILIPDDPAAKVDWEAELAVVIGRRGKDIPEEQALRHVAGYTGVNDISWRGPHHVAHPLAEAFGWDWLASKARDASCPLGPGIRPSFLVPDPQALSVRLWLNGELRQEASTSDMITEVAGLIAAASRLMTLEPGDVIATGTPHGVGNASGEFLRPGDVVEMEIADFGRLSNPVADMADMANLKTIA